MVSTWGARDEIEKGKERESKRSCQNQTRRRRSGYLAYLIGTRNESMEQVRTHGDPSLLTTFPKEIESKRCLPQIRIESVTTSVPRCKQKKNIFVDYVGSPITNESRKLNNRFFRSSLPLHRFVNSYYPLYHFDTCEQISYYSSQNNSLPFFHSIPPNSRSLILERKRERRIQPEYFLFSCGLLS